MTYKWLSTASGAALLATMPIHAALAQEPAAPASADADQAEGGDGGAIVVTGSRIARQDYSSSTPIVTLDAGRIEQTGSVTVESALNQLPQFTASATSTEGGFPNRGGQAQLNLRGLGTNRALVLLDGRRIQPSNPDGTVDVNTIPANLVGSVETITGGASAAYGSDAMSGVVNFLLKKRFNGVQIDGQQSITTRGDGRTTSLSGLFGTGFGDDRGHITLSASYSSRDSVSRSARSFFSESFNNARLPRATLLVNANPPTQAAVDALFAGYGFAPGSVPRTSPLGYNADGTLFSSPGSAPVVNYRGPIDNQFTIQNNAVLFRSGQTYPLQLPLERYNLFGNASYKLTDAIEIYGQGLYTHYTSDLTVSPISLGAAGQNGSLPVTNPFIPGPVQTLLAARANPTAPVPFTYLFSQLGVLNTHVDADIYQFQLGIRGEFGSDWTWDIYGSKGRTHTVSTLENAASRTAIARLLDAPDGGASLCAGGFNPFADPSAALSAACLDFIRRSADVVSSFDQHAVEATAQGSLFTLPAGEVRLALGANYRRDKYVQTPDQSYQSGELLSFAPQLPSTGRQSVKEVFAELLVPLVHSTPLIEQLDLSLAYRLSDYSTVGSVSTYKADLEWRITPWARVRGGYARAIRAPSLGELFNPTVSSSVVIGNPSATSTGGDPCDIRSSYRQGANAANVRALCLAQGVPAASIDSFTFTSTQIFANASGNRALEEEKADTYSLGLILRSPAPTGLFSNLQLSVDHYRIKIDDAIGTLPFATGLANCFNAGGANPNYDPTNVNCVVVARNPVGTITGGLIPTLNLASYKVSGIDFQADWSIPLDDIGVDRGRLVLNSVVSHLMKFDLQAFSGAPSLDYSGFSSSPIAANVLPKWKGTTTATFRTPGGEVGVRWRYIGATRDVSRLLTPTSRAPGPSAYNYFDLFGNIRVAENFVLRAGLNNVFDKGPPQIGTSPSTTDIQTYDLLGRNAYIGLVAKF